MAKIYDEKAIKALAEEMVTRSNDHGKYMQGAFCKVLAYTFRSGRTEILSGVWSKMENGADKLLFAQTIKEINSRLFSEFKAYFDADTVVAIVAAGQVKDKGKLTMFSPSEDKIVWAGKSEETEDKSVKTSQQLFRRAIREHFADDDELAVAFEPLLSKVNADTKRNAETAFDMVKYLKRVVTTVISKAETDDLASSVAKDLNNVIRGHFGKAKAFSAEELNDDIKARHDKDEEEAQKALELLRKRGYDVSAPKPEVVINGEATEVKKGEAPKVDPRKIAAA